MTESMVVFSILMTNISIAEIEEGTEVANSASLNCSTVEVVDMEDNRVGVVVKSLIFWLVFRLPRRPPRCFRYIPTLIDCLEPRKGWVLICWMLFCTNVTYRDVI